MLLGGKTKDRLPVYATTVRPDVAKRLGFKVPSCEAEASIRICNREREREIESALIYIRELRSLSRTRRRKV
jgi:hypothetical protein